MSFVSDSRINFFVSSYVYRDYEAASAFFFSNDKWGKRLSSFANFRDVREPTELVETFIWKSTSLIQFNCEFEIQTTCQNLRWDDFLSNFWFGLESRLFYTLAMKSFWKMAKDDPLLRMVHEYEKMFNFTSAFMTQHMLNICFFLSHESFTFVHTCLLEFFTLLEIHSIQHFHADTPTFSRRTSFFSFL